MRIDTRYDHGQTVWYIDSERDCRIETCPTCGTTLQNIWGKERYIPAKSKIAEINLHYGGGFDYKVEEHRLQFVTFQEEELYPSEAAAQAYCDRRNTEEANE